jgi:hypothetical protein
MFADVYSGKRILPTGRAGFKACFIWRPMKAVILPEAGGAVRHPGPLVISEESAIKPKNP